MSGDVKTSEILTSCPNCGKSPVTFVDIGAAGETPASCTAEVAGATVTVFNVFSFLSCPACGHSWHLPAKGTA